VFKITRVEWKTVDRTGLADFSDFFRRECFFSTLVMFTGELQKVDKKELAAPITACTKLPGGI